MIECKMISRKPLLCYSVVMDSRKVFLVKNANGTERSMRWMLLVGIGEDKFFPSKRAALHFFKTGEKFKTNPVYAARGGKNSKIRIR